MKAMILAAGRGERMRPLTDNCPKPLLKAGGIPLIEYHIQKLAKVGITDIVINHAWMGNKLVEYCGDGSRWQVNITYSDESQGALETAGGIMKALPLLCDKQDDFLVINGDIYSDYILENLPTLPEGVLAYLWLVNNPEHNIDGDFKLAGRYVKNIENDKSATSYTFSGIALYKKAFFQPNKQSLDVINKQALGPLLKVFADKHCVMGEVLKTYWVDVGTPARLHDLDLILKGS